MSSYEMNKQGGYPPNPDSSPAYPPNPSDPPGYSFNPPGYPPNAQGYPPNLQGYPPYLQGYPPSLPGPTVFVPNQVPIYSNVQLPYYGGHSQPGVIVTTQPNLMVLPQPAYKDYLAWSVVNLLFCNLVLGFVAVIFSSKTRSAVRRGDATSAASYSHTAFSLNVAALVLGIIVNICWISWVIYWSVTYQRTVNSYYNNGYYG